MGCQVSAPLQPIQLPPQQILEQTAAAPRSSASTSDINFVDNLSEYGTYKFKGAVAAPYLKAVGLAADVLDDPKWQESRATADKVAEAVMKWAKEKGASMVSHWFQPLGSAGVRRGQTGQVHNAMFNFGEDNVLKCARTASPVCSCSQGLTLCTDPL
jgi:glutamine synthetase type III